MRCMADEFFRLGIILSLLLLVPWLPTLIKRMDDTVHAWLRKRWPWIH
jgi:hypothetical protein